MSKTIADLFALPFAGYALCFANAAALAFALTFQFGFGVQPCHLCLMQRWPFVVAGLLALGATLSQAHTARRKILLALCAVALLGNAGLALFHSGVERHWWEWQSSCTGSLPKNLSIENLRQQLLSTPPTRCDEITWSLFGLSMANLNIAYSIALALYALSASAGRHGRRS